MPKPQIGLPLGFTLQNGKYCIEKILGKGGFGITYLAEDTFAQQNVVIKEFFLSGYCLRNAQQQIEVQGLQEAEYQSYKEKFLQEAQIIARLKGTKSIIEVIDFFEENGTAYMVMPFVAEENLEAYTQKQPENRLSEAEALPYIYQIATALEVLHAQNILHRDIKPSNILRKANGEIILIDFGSAREWILSDYSQTMSAIISPGYAPPEQYNPSAKRTPSSDIYALAATLYRLLTASIPLDATARTLDDLPEPASLVDISTPVNQAIMKALALRPLQRFQTIKEFVAALKGEILVEIGTKKQGSNTFHYGLVQAKAIKAFEQKKYKEALAYLQEILDFFPKDAYALKKVAECERLLLTQQKNEKQQRWILSISISIILMVLISVLWINRKQENIISKIKTNKDTISKKDSDTLKNQHIAQNLNEKMILIDSAKTESLPKEPVQLVALRAKADAAFSIKDYDKAKLLYEKCLNWKPKDEYFSQQIIHCVAEKKAILEQKAQEERMLKMKERNQASQVTYGKILNWHDSQGQVFDYEGEIRNNKPNGKGKMKYKDGTICEGALINGILSGQCRCAFYNGDLYIGEILADKRSGKGTYYYKGTGGRYIGEWRNDKENGKGTWYYSNGDKYEADFVNGNPVGKIRYRKSNGKIILGRWENGKFVAE